MIKDKNLHENNLVNRENRAFANLNTTLAANNKPGRTSIADEFESLRILNDAGFVKKLKCGSYNARKMKGKFAFARIIL
ncbi:MAG TPA: hypothetical protein PKK26_17890 [Candidatus Wallbacteria bacterium]|nr:hypothetical protein [Candidatus Wallbacteria bacterium]